MACNASKTTFLRAVNKRGYSAAAKTRALGKPADVQTTVLPSKIVIATADSALPISSVSIVFRAGSRNESYENQGASHLLRLASNWSTKYATGFAISRHLQQMGASLTAHSDREIVSYTLQTTADNLDNGLKYLQELVQPVFKPWEIQDTLPLLKNQLAAICPQTKAIELLHKAAYRTGLGYSVFMPKYQIGKISSESLMHYFTNNCTASRCAVVGVGVDQNMLSGFAQELELPNGEGRTSLPSYYGGDARKDSTGHTAHVAIAGQGGAFNNLKEALAFGILQQAIAGPPATKRGNLNNGIGKAIADANCDATFNFKPINICYADAGLFGFFISADTTNICKAIDAATKVLKTANVSENDFCRAKTQLKVIAMEVYASDRKLLPEMAMQAALVQKVVSADAMVAAIDAVTHEDVQEAAKKAGSSKLSIGAVGNLANVPYASDL